MNLDKNSQKVLKYFIKSGTNQSWSTIAFNLHLTPNKDVDIEIIQQAIEDLLEAECIKQVSNYDNCPTYKLTNYGKMYFKNKTSDSFYKYWFPIITSTLALLLSLLADWLLK